MDKINEKSPALMLSGPQVQSRNEDLIYLFTAADPSFWGWSLVKMTFYFSCVYSIGF